MGLSFGEYTGDGSTTDYPLSFALGYISEEDIHAYVDNVEVTNFTIIMDGSALRFDRAPGAGERILIRRIMDKDSLIHDYEDGSNLTAQSLDESNKQAIMISQETIDGFVDSLNITNDLNMAGNRIYELQSNTGDPTEATRFDYSLETRNLINSIIGGGENTVINGFKDFVGTKGQTTFVTGNNPLNAMVWVQGVLQRPNIDFSVTSNGIELTTATQAGEVVGVLYASTSLGGDLATTIEELKEFEESVDTSVAAAKKSAQEAATSASTASSAAVSAQSFADDAEEQADFLRDATATASSIPSYEEATVSLNDGLFTFGIPLADIGNAGDLEIEDNITFNDYLVFNKNGEDTVLKVRFSELEDLFSQGLVVRGSWNVATNTIHGDPLNDQILKDTAPSYPVGGSPIGFTYYAEDTGTFDLNGTTNPEQIYQGDRIVWEGNMWVLIHAGAPVRSVNGEIGDVVLTASDVSAYTKIQVDNLVNPIVSDVTQLETSVAANTTNISSNTADITTNTASIATNTTDIATNASDISALQTAVSNIPSDIVEDLPSDSAVDTPFVRTIDADGNTEWSVYGGGSLTNVTSVNNQVPDALGNVELVPSDLGAYTTAETDTAITTAVTAVTADSLGVYTKTETDTAISTGIAAITPSSIGAYSTAETDTAIATEIGNITAADVGAYTTTQVDNLLPRIVKVEATALGGETKFTQTNNFDTAMVWVQGVLQSEALGDYTISGKVITLSTGLVTGEQIQIMTFGNGG